METNLALITRDKDYTYALRGPDGTPIDITIRTSDRQVANKWIAAFTETHGLSDRPPARQAGISVEQAISRAFPVLGVLMIALMAAAVLVAIAQSVGVIEPFAAAALIGRLLLLAAPLVCFVLALIGVEARLHRSGGSISRVTKRGTA